MLYRRSVVAYDWSNTQVLRDVATGKTYHTSKLETWSQQTVHTTVIQLQQSSL